MNLTVYTEIYKLILVITLQPHSKRSKTANRDKDFELNVDIYESFFLSKLAIKI